MSSRAAISKFSFASKTPAKTGPKQVRLSLRVRRRASRRRLASEANLLTPNWLERGARIARPWRGDVGSGSVHLGGEAFEHPVRDPVEDLVRRPHMFHVIEVRPHRPTHLRPWVRRQVAHRLDEGHSIADLAGQGCEQVLLGAVGEHGRKPAGGTNSARLGHPSVGALWPGASRARRHVGPDAGFHGEGPG